MTRTWDRDGNPTFVGELTPEELQELEDFALCGRLPFVRLPKGADRTKVTPLPFPRARRPLKL